MSVADITAPRPGFFVMEVNVVFETESVAHKEGSSLEEEKEMRECESSVNEVNMLSEHIRMPEPMEKMEEE